MIEFKRFVAARMAEIQRQIDDLPEYDKEGRAGDSLGIDLAFHQSALDVVADYEGERSFARLQVSRSLSARLDRAGRHE